MRPLLHKIGIITYLGGETEGEASWLREDECREGGIERGSRMREV